MANRTQRADPLTRKQNRSVTVPVTLGLMMLAQLIVTGFFIADIVSDFHEIGWAFPQDSHLYSESFAVLVLVVTIVLETTYLTRLLRRKERLETSLSLARAAIQDVVDAQFRDWGLTAAERDVATFLVKGLSTAEIARLRGSAEGTVKAHLHGIYRKSGTGNRAEVLSVLIEGLMDDRPEADLPAIGEEPASGNG